MKNIIFLLILSSLIFSCKKQSEPKKEFQKKPKRSIVKNNPNYLALDSYSFQEISTWKEYNTLTNFLQRYKNVSANEALSNALELRDLVKNLKDSIKPETLDNNAFNARINVLQNETLRLSDMTFISSIKADEVNQQVLKILDVYSSLNNKINTVYSQKRFEDAIKVGGEFIGIDTSKTTITKPRSLRKIIPKQQKEKNIFKKLPPKKRKILKEEHQLNKQ